MLRRPAALIGGLAALTALVLTGGPATVVASGPVLGPSGLPALSATYKAGENPAREHEDPVPALPDAGIADLNTVGKQVAYAKQAAALPGAEAGRAWKNIGPFGQDDPSTYPTGGTRFARGAGMGVAAAVDPRDSSGNTLFIGTMGGLWRSTNGGRSWTALGDDSFLRSGIGAVAIDPNHPNDVYAGTGIALATLSGDTPGTGVYVSHDNGKHFTRPAKNVLGYGVNVITPTTTGVFVGTSHGLYVSTDRGASFHRVTLPSNANHTGPSAGAYADWITAIVVQPRAPREVTVAVGLPYGKRPGPDGKPLSPGNGLYRTKGGASGAFTYFAGSAGLTNPDATNDPLGRIVLAYGGRDTETPVLWAIVQDAGLLNKAQPAGLDVIGTTTGKSLNATNTLLNGVYRSDDNGATWTLKATPASLTASPNDGLGVYPALGYGIGVQAFYNLWLAVDPRNSANIFFGLEEVFQSVAGTDASKSMGQFEVVQKYWDVCGTTTYLENVYTGTTCPDGTPYYGGPATHPDQHVGVIAELPGGAIRLYTGNDGGFFRQDSHALTTGGSGFDQDHWTDMNHLASVQPYRVARTPAGQYVTALQDNGGGLFSPGGTNTLISSGDGVFAIATSNPDVFYTSAQGAILYVTKDRGKHITEIQPDLTSPNFMSPIAIDPLNENHLVAAAQDVEETTLGANTTTTLDPVLYTVVTTDWKQVFDAGKSPYIEPVTKKDIYWTSQALAVRGAAVYNAVCGLCRNSLGDPTVIHTRVVTNVGKPGCTPKTGAADCWHMAASNGLPHVAIQAVVIDPADVKTLYVALNENSNIGYDQKVVGSARVMVSHDAGEHFSDLSGNLPRSNARDLIIRNGQLIVGGDNGVFTAKLGTARWSRLGKGLPAARVYDLDLDRSGRYLSVASYGRGVWVLDFQGKAVTSSTGPGRTTTGGRSTSTAGGALPATGLGGLPWAAGAVLLVGLVLRHRRRAA